MCKFVFIATQQAVKELPFQESEPGFSVEKIGDAFKAIRTKFNNPNIYLVCTSNGCGCDFGVTAAPDLESLEAQLKQSQYPLDKLRQKIQMLVEGKENWLRKHRLKLEEHYKKEKAFEEETQQLAALIRENTSATSEVELYCCWAGDYEAETEATRKLKVSDTAFFNRVDLELNEKLIFVS